MTPKKNIWDKIYKNLPDKNIPWEQESLEKTKPTSLMFSLFTKYLQNGRVLDIGCGRGQYSFFLKKHGYTPTGIDVSSTAVRQAEKRVKGVEFKVADALEIPFKNEYFDGTIDIGVFHYLNKKNASKYIKEIARVLRKGGVYGFFNFSDDDPACKSVRHGSMSRLGVSVYFSTQEYINSLFSKYFDLKNLQKITWGSSTSRSANNIHSAWCVIAIKK